MDTTQMPAEMRAQVRESREQQLAQLRAELPAPVIEALEPRAAELQKRSLELAFSRVKAAGG
jgi:hypothetical protein